MDTKLNPKVSKINYNDVIDNINRIKSKYPDNIPTLNKIQERIQLKIADFVDDSDEEYLMEELHIINGKLVQLELELDQGKPIDETLLMPTYNLRLRRLGYIYDVITYIVLSLSVINSLCKVSYSNVIQLGIYVMITINIHFIENITRLIIERKIIFNFVRKRAPRDHLFKLPRRWKRYRRIFETILTIWGIVLLSLTPRNQYGDLVIYILGIIYVIYGMRWCAIGIIGTNSV